jgi:predicted phosphodiesterase
MDCKLESAQALIAKEINESDGVDFMVTAGDNFYVKETSDVNFTSNVVNCYSKPMYASMGNHDIPFYEQELGFRHQNWILPAKNYIINVTTPRGSPRLRILMINTNPVYAEDDYRKRNSSPNQYRGDLEELEYFLDNIPPSDLFTIIVGHHPLIKNRHKDKGEKMTMDGFGRRIASMCNMYVCADEHNLQHIIQGNLNQFILGGGGAKPDETIVLDYPHDTKYAHPFHGFGVFDVRKMKMTMKCMEKGSGKISTCHKYFF